MCTYTTVNQMPQYMSIQTKHFFIFYIFKSFMSMTFNFQANIPFVLGTPALPSTFNAILNATANALYALSALW
jgi:hypothetical protein